MNDVLVAAHIEEAKKQKAEIYNLGISQSEDCIESQTSGGVLMSTIREGDIEHEWLKAFTCVLCGAREYGFGNNPAPLAIQGLCCDLCNGLRVIPERLKQLHNH